MTCKRNFTREQELERQGFVESRLVEIDEQSSVLKFKWKQ